MKDADLPALFAAADRLSLAGQATSVRGTSAYLVLLLIAAGGGLVDWEVRDGAINVGGAVSVLAFASSLVMGFFFVQRRPEARWYRARAAAESAKTLAWKYAVGGAPFPVGVPDPDGLLVRRLSEVVGTMRDLGLPPPDGGAQITAAMRRLRADTPERRRQAYLRGRIDDQCSWYSKKALVNDRRGRQWAITSSLLLLTGLVCGAARALGFTDLDLLGLLAAAAASAAAWAQLRQHRTLAASYGTAAQELALTRPLLERVVGEDDWARAVSDAEEAISREHATWIARRGTVGGAVPLPLAP